MDPIVYDESWHWCPNCHEPREACFCDYEDAEDDEPPCNNIAHDSYDEVPCPVCGELP